MTRMNVMKLVAWLAICQLPGIWGVQYVYSNMGWYRTLMHPALTPPEAWFGIVWGVLYLTLGVSAFFVFREKLHLQALLLFILQLALNACWTPVFFGAHSLFGALMLIIAMLVAWVFLAKACYLVNRGAAWLLVPYGLWLTFATYLTAATWWMN